MTDSNATPLLTVEQFQRALGGAAWNWDLHAFCKALDWPVDEYAKEKFLVFQELGRHLSVFDEVTLNTIVVTRIAQRAQEQAKAKP